MNLKKLLIFIISIATLLIISGVFDRSHRIVDAFNMSDFSAIERVSYEPKVGNKDIAVSYTGLPRYSYSPPNSGGYGGASYNSISIAGRIIPVVDVADTTINAGNHVNKYGNYFYYGHNTSAVFGGIVNLGVGDTFSINYNGVNHNYRVSKTMIFEKNVERGLLQLNGSGSYMKNVSLARSNGVQYSVSLMTCYGVSYGNGDASHRFVIFANEY
ncbi:sortase [Candidatus Saccharibacteria bacterium]|nr:sortase [Candidatus Saccharibacteria bacterium]MBR3176341.1 sortase [Candidatus Saccharibacteria bacterium]